MAAFSVAVKAVKANLPSAVANTFRPAFPFAESYGGQDGGQAAGLSLIAPQFATHSLGDG